jgi:DNA-binding transcriptional LysR family regulator
MAKVPIPQIGPGHIHGALDLKALRLAVLVSDVGSVRLAAQRSSATAPFVSRRVRALEDMLGVSLFERRSVGMRPTDAGTRFLDVARRLLAQLDTAAGHARDAGAATVGRLIIASYFSASLGRFRDSLIRFAQRQPEVVFSLMEGSRAELVLAVQERRADLAILVSSGVEAGLEHLALWQEPALMALPKGHPQAGADTVRWSDLINDTFLVTRLGLGLESRRLIHACLPSVQRAKFLEHDISREGLFSLIGAGLGITVLAESGSGPRYPGVVFRPVGDENGPTTYGISAYWDAKRDNPPLRRFLAMLRSAQRSGPSSPDGP